MLHPADGTESCNRLLVLLPDQLFRPMQAKTLWYCFVILRRIQGASFGGRLVFRGNKGVASALANRGQVLIFQTPPANRRSHMGFGRGKIWIGRRTCQGSSSQLPGLCPWTAGDRPCLSTKLPCDTDFVSEAPSYAQSYPLEFSEVSQNSIKVSWPAWDETTDLGVGPITGYKILYREPNETFQKIVLDPTHSYHQIDGLTSGTTYEFQVVLVRDGLPSEGRPSNVQNITTLCRELEHVDLHVETMPMSGLEKSLFNVSWRLPSLTENCEITHQQITLHQLDVADCYRTTRTIPRDYFIQTGTRSKIFGRLRSYSLYNITYLARNLAGTYVTSQLHRTAETIPSEAPRELTYTTMGSRVRLSWIVPRCGFRNGVITGYKRTIIRNGGSPWHGIRRAQQHTILRLTSGDEWIFRVQACTAVGCGPVAAVNGTRT
ncbi:Phosphatidylinositol phosphatase PTPRQ [Holothuria leucospilota]|uniref:Phosphatidylinositol phosphatase PTPRQ n=1 Tax=Holothuria leucospilota TaxID=206669 RepID=A0A9Q1HFW3_HOLLE|nr:Phosphatidylinositol phosphatase PTPRQ [Holothuria leucospilota]